MSGERSDVSLLSKHSPHINLHCSSEGRETLPTQIWGWSSLLLKMKAAQTLLVSDLVQFNQSDLAESTGESSFRQVLLSVICQTWQSLPEFTTHMESPVWEDRRGGLGRLPVRTHSPSTALGHQAGCDILWQ